MKKHHQRRRGVGALLRVGRCTLHSRTRTKPIYNRYIRVRKTSRLQGSTYGLTGLASGVPGQNRVTRGRVQVLPKKSSGLPVRPGYPRTPTLVHKDWTGFRGQNSGKRDFTYDIPKK